MHVFTAGIHTSATIIAFESGAKGTKSFSYSSFQQKSVTKTILQFNRSFIRLREMVCSFSVGGAPNLQPLTSLTSLV